MKLLKYIPLLIILTFLNSNVYAAQNCGEIKGNIVGKLFCKAKTLRSGSADMSTSSTTTESTTEAKKWKFWKRPEWTKRKK